MPRIKPSWHSSALDEIKLDGYNPMIRAMVEAFGLAISSGIVLIMLFIAAQFEALHYWLSEMKARTLAAIGRHQGGYYPAGGRIGDRLEYDVSHKLRYSAACPGKAALWFPATGTASDRTVAAAFSATSSRTSSRIGFIRTDTLPTRENSTATRTNARLGTDEHQLEMPELARPELSTWNRELSGHGIDALTDPALNQEADKDSIQRIIDKGLGNHAHPTRQETHTPAKNIRKGGRTPRSSGRAHLERECSAGTAGCTQTCRRNYQRMNYGKPPGCIRSGGMKFRPASSVIPTDRAKRFLYLSTCVGVENAHRITHRHECHHGLMAMEGCGGWLVKAEPCTGARLDKFLKV
ncbi:MAG: hypothetical protein R3E95_06765 [Thiolinea sp.]